MGFLDLTFKIVKEILVFLLLFSAIFSLSKNKYFSGLSIITKLKVLLLCGVSLTLVYAIFTLFFPGTENEYQTGLVNIPVLNIILSGIFSLLIGVIYLIAVVAISELMLCFRKKYTVLNLKILVFLSFLYIIWANLKGGISPQINMGNGFLFKLLNDTIINETVFNVFEGIVIFSILLNSFRSGWVQFLTKKQKLSVLVGSLAVIIFVITADSYQIKDVVPYFSATLGNFLHLSFLYFLLYAIFSALNILLHLPGAGIFDRKVKQLSSLHQLSSSVASVLDINKLVIDIVKHTYEITNSSGVWLLLRESENEPFIVASSKHVLPDDKRFINLEPNSYLNSKILETGSSLIINQIGRELSLGENSKGSLIGIPLCSSKLGIIGILYAIKTIDYGFGEDEDNMLKAFANHAVVAIENARYFKESLEKRELEKELVVAKRIQEKLLPKEIPEIHEFEIATLNLPCKEVGGDYYDLIKIDERKLGIAIADVSGKGIPASLLMSNLQACLRILSHEKLPINKIVSRINDIICENTDDYQFITFFYAVLDSENKKITYCNAGHNPPILFRKDGTEDLLGEGGLILGWQKNISYDEEEIAYNPGDRIVLYTDGVVEAMNDSDEEFDEWRLKKIIKENGSNSPQIIIDEIIKGVKLHISGYPQIDDLTLIAVRVTD